MKKILLFIAMLLIIPINCYALDISDYFFTDDDTKVVESVDHSLFAFGNNLTTESEVNGILFAGANNVTINGKSDYGVVGGNTVLINGNIENDLYVFGETVTIKGTVNKDLYVFGNNVRIDTTVGGNVFAYAQNLNIENANVNGFLLTASNAILASENTQIGDVLKYNKDAVIKVKGSSDKLPDNIKIETYKTTNNSEIKKENTIATTVLSFFGAYISRILIAFLIAGLLTKLYKYIVRKSRDAKRAVIECLLGFAVLVLTPVAFIIIILTMIGVKLSFILLVLYILLLLISNEVSMIFIGNRVYTRLLKKKDNKYLSAFIGVTLISLLALIPYLGGLVTFISIILGLGILVDMGIAAFKYCNK